MNILKVFSRSTEKSAVFSSFLLEKYLPKKYFPVTSSSIDFHSLQVLVNDIIINKRKNIIEIGSGLSSIVLANLKKDYSFIENIYSVESNKEYIEILKNSMDKDSLSNINFIHAPLIKNSPSDQLEWYDKQVIDSKIMGIKFDTVFVDGPLAYTKELQLSRYPALPFILNQLNQERFSIFLDDSNRNGEKIILKKWSKILNLEIKKFSKSFKGFIKGDYFNIKV